MLNGGFYQFFFNSTGIVWKDALEGFKLLGMYKHADIIQKAILKFGKEIPFDRKQRQESIKNLSFDDEDYEYCISDDELSDIIIEYAATNPKAFVFNEELNIPVDMKD